MALTSEQTSNGYQRCQAIATAGGLHQCYKAAKMWLGYGRLCESHAAMKRVGKTISLIGSAVEND